MWCTHETLVFFIISLLNRQPKTSDDSEYCHMCTSEVNSNICKRFSFFFYNKMIFNQKPDRPTYFFEIKSNKNRMEWGRRKICMMYDLHVMTVNRNKWHKNREMLNIIKIGIETILSFCVYLLTSLWMLSHCRINVGHSKTKNYYFTSFFSTFLHFCSAFEQFYCLCLPFLWHSIHSLFWSALFSRCLRNSFCCFCLNYEKVCIVFARKYHCHVFSCTLFMLLIILRSLYTDRQ